MLKCSGCGVEDRVITIDGEPEHFVRIDMRFIEKPDECTPKLRARGWQYRLFNHKHAMWRGSCRECAKARFEADSVFAEMRKEALDRERDQQPDTYWNQLCEE